MESNSSADAMGLCDPQEDAIITSRSNSLRIETKGFWTTRRRKKGIQAIIDCPLLACSELLLNWEQDLHLHVCRKVYVGNKIDLNEMSSYLNLPIDGPFIWPKCTIIFWLGGIHQAEWIMMPDQEGGNNSLLHVYITQLWNIVLRSTK